MEEYEFIESCEHINYKKIIEIYIENGWGKKPSDYSVHSVELAFKNSTYVIIAKHENNIIGWARLLSDGVYNSWITEIIISPKYQRKGIGSKLIEKISAKFSHTAIWLETFKKNKKFFTINKLQYRENMIVCSKGSCK